MVTMATPALPRSTLSQPTADWHAPFLQLLPAIRRQARFCFRRLRSEEREEAVQEVVANALHAFLQLWHEGRAHRAFASPLARFAVARVCAGRCLGRRRNSRDIHSLACQRRGLRIGSLDDRAADHGPWRALVVEDRRAGPAEIAATRLDLEAWLRLLPERYRRLVRLLALGETTTATAKLFQISPARVSQMRRELYETWCGFQGEGATAT